MRILLLALSIAFACCQTFAVTLTGTVTGPDGQPTPGADLWLYRIQYQPQHSSTLVATGRSGADGAFSFEDTFDPGQARMHCDLYAHRPGFPILRCDAYEVDKPIALKFVSPVVRDVTVTLPDGTPIPGLQIIPLSFSRVVQSDSGESVPREVAKVAARTTDAGGRFTLIMPPAAARAMLEVFAAGYGTGEITLDVRPNVLRVALQPAGSLSGKVTEPDGAPIPGLDLTLEMQPDLQGRTELGGTQHTITDPQGAFRLPEVPPGKWYVMALGQPGGERLVREGIVEVRSGQEATLELKAEPTVALRGRLVDETTGQGVAHITVSFRYGYYLRSMVRAKTDAQGRFELRVLPGQGHLSVWYTDHLTYVPPKWLDVPTTDLADMKVNVLRELQVLVSDAQGHVPKWARVIARQEGQPAGSVQASCDPEGHCTLKGLGGAEATIQAVPATSPPSR